ncbi:MAG TPA: hypothetical protein PLU11_09815 [Chitinophagaceae bacterium]|nr:hypothetical protein [Chitinophagaceae bacterium]HPH31083.1 hypothetical protein [Chitinophagaceae bacterium]HPN59461.1 hypothetical protein [Chitinophagaceae bacterium]
MDTKVKGHTAAFLKRQAKNLKKTKGISYLSALDQVALNAGFTNWNNFVNLLNATTADSRSNQSGRKEPSRLSLTQNQQASDINPYKKLLIAALNELLNRNLISLTAPNDSVDEKGHVFLELFGYTSVVMWDDIGFEELRISVWWKYDHSKHPQANLTGNAKESFSCASPLANRFHYKNFVGITASGWLERKVGKYLQGKGNRGIFDIYTRKGEKTELEKISTPTPNGFGIEGPVHM